MQCEVLNCGTAKVCSMFSLLANSLPGLPVYVLLLVHTGALNLLVSTFWQLHALPVPFAIEMMSPCTLVEVDIHSFDRFICHLCIKG